MSRENGAEHGMAYDAANNIIYEVNHPRNGQGDQIDGLINWVEGNIFSLNTAGVKFDDTKSTAYVWNMNDKNFAAAFWAREKGNNYLLAPVNVSNPSATTAWFQSNSGRWDYNFPLNNCAHYACMGMNAGGAGINIPRVFIPSRFPREFTMRWVNGNPAPTKIGN